MTDRLSLDWKIHQPLVDVRGLSVDATSEFNVHVLAELNLDSHWERVCSMALSWAMAF